MEITNAMGSIRGGLFVQDHGGVIVANEGAGALQFGRAFHIDLLETTVFPAADAFGYSQFVDFQEGCFLLQYTGDATTATVTIVDNTSIATTLAGDQTDGSVDLAINIALAAFDTVAEVVAFINAQTGYSATYSTSKNRRHFKAGIPSTWLVAVVGQDIKTAAYEVLHDGNGGFTLVCPVGYVMRITNISVQNLGAGVLRIKPYYLSSVAAIEEPTGFVRVIASGGVLNEELSTPGFLRGDLTGGEAIRFKADPNALGDDVLLGISGIILPVTPGSINVKAPQDQ